MTTVTTGSSPGPNHTWAGADFVWTSDAGDKTWATAYPIVYSLSVDEPLGLLELIARGIGLRALEAFAVSDQGATATAYVRSFVRTLSFAEGVRRDFALNKAERLQMQDGYDRIVEWLLAVNESIGFQETYTDIIAFLINVSESFGIADGVGKATVLGEFLESFAVSEAPLEKVIGLGISESLIVGEDFGRMVAFYLRLAESLAIGELLSKLSDLKLTEGLTVSEGIVKDIDKAVIEPLMVADALGRVATFNRVYAETLSVDDAIGKAFSLPFAEAIQVYESYRRNGNSVISDIVIDDGDLTETEFAELMLSSAAVGFSNFKQFIVGDYDYQRALYRLVMSSTTADRPAINELTLTVDVPDIFDRGTASIPIGGTTVNFNRPFYVPPEVAVTLKAGTVIATPEVSAPTRDGFFVELKDGAGNSVAGTVTWQAHGY